MKELSSPNRDGGPLLSPTIVTDGQWHRITSDLHGTYGQVYDLMKLAGWSTIILCS